MTFRDDFYGDFPPPLLTPVNPLLRLIKFLKGLRTAL